MNFTNHLTKTKWIVSLGPTICAMKFKQIVGIVTGTAIFLILFIVSFRGNCMLNILTVESITPVKIFVFVIPPSKLWPCTLGLCPGQKV